MATPEAVKKMKEKYGEDYFKRIGRAGGSAHNKGGFRDRDLAARAGRLGGLKSRKKVDRAKTQA